MATGYARPPPHAHRARMTAILDDETATAEQVRDLRCEVDELRKAIREQRARDDR